MPAAQHPHPLAGLLCLALPRRHSLTASTAMYACTLPCIFPVIIRSAGCICRKSRNKPWAYFSGHHCWTPLVCTLCSVRTPPVAQKQSNCPFDASRPHFLARFCADLQSSVWSLYQSTWGTMITVHTSLLLGNVLGLGGIYVNNMGMTCTLQVNACHMSCKDNSTRYHRT